MAPKLDLHPRSDGTSTTGSLQGQGAYARLLDEIRDGALTPGTRLTETEIASRLDISRTPVREAIRQLEADGLVRRTVYPEVPPKVEYQLTDWGQALCPVLDALLSWREGKPPAAVDGREP